MFTQQPIVVGYFNYDLTYQHNIKPDYLANANFTIRNKGKNTEVGIVFELDLKVDNFHVKTELTQSSILHDTVINQSEDIPKELHDELLEPLIIKTTELVKIMTGCAQNTDGYMINLKTNIITKGEK